MAFFCGSSASFVILLFAVVLVKGITDDQNIIAACKTISGAIDPQFCEDALRSDPRSTKIHLDYRAFAIIAADLLAANATSTAAKIDGLLRDGGGRDDATTRGLRSCKLLYSGILQSQASCKAAIKEKRDAEANSLLEKSATAAKKCDDGFASSSPLTEEDSYTSKLANLASALLNVMNF